MLENLATNTFLLDKIFHMGLVLSPSFHDYQEQQSGSMKEGQCQRKGEASTRKTAVNVWWVFMFFLKTGSPKSHLL